MRKHTDSSILAVASYIKYTDKSIREVATDFGLAKSTVHDMMKKSLRKLDSQLADEIQEIFSQHKYRPNRTEIRSRYN